MESKNVTIHQLAAKLNLSASTISRALANNPRIGKATRELVRKTAEELNYKPNQLASNLRRGKGKLIGVVVPRINRNFFSHAIAGMEAIINPAGYTLMICQTNERLETERASIETMINNRVDGIIISLSSETVSDEHIVKVIEQDVPVVMFDRVFTHLDVDKVLNDNLLAAYNATKHLLVQGYKRIVHFSGPLHINVYAERLQGYKNAMAEAGIIVEPNMIYENVLTREVGTSIAHKMITANQLPDAIFSASDFSALGAMLVFKEEGILLSRNIGIVGFANEPFTELTEPALTTLEQHCEEMGKTAAQMLINRLEDTNSNIPCGTVIFEPKLIIRSSSIRN